MSTLTKKSREEFQGIVKAFLTTLIGKNADSTDEEVNTFFNSFVENGTIESFEYDLDAETLEFSIEVYYVDGSDRFTIKSVKGN